jgi:hypothetical protein
VTCYRRLCERAFYSLSLRERVGVRDSGCPVRAGVPPPNLLPKGGGTKQKDFCRAFYRKPFFSTLPCEARFCYKGFSFMGKAGKIKKH